MAETTNISKLIINYLTEEQYTTAQSSGLINANELYIESAQRLLGVAHPANHPPSIITQDAGNRFVTDVEKTAWNGKAASDHTHGGITNDGKVGTVANKAIYTGTGGAVQAGTLPLSAGGTGATTAAAARTSLGAASRTSGTATLAAASWVGTAAPYTYEVSIAGLTADDVLDIKAVDGMDKAAADLIKEAWSKAVGYVDPDTGAGKVTFYASEKPAVAIPIYWRLIK